MFFTLKFLVSKTKTCWMNEGKCLCGVNINKHTLIICIILFKVY